MIFDPGNIGNLLPHHNNNQGFLEVLESRTNLGFVGLDLSSLIYIYIHLKSKIYYNIISIQISIEGRRTHNEVDWGTA
jgi:hypothetical protein